jgi:hypothetical protein
VTSLPACAPANDGSAFFVVGRHAEAVILLAPRTPCGVSWNPNMLLARAECYSSTGGIHQWLAGGNHHWDAGWKGTNLQKLTRNTVQVYRQPDDDVCPQVRVRVWKRSRQVYLPVVLSNYDSP